MTRRALLIGISASGLNVRLALERLGPVLERLGFSQIERCTGDRATRRGILDRLDALVTESLPGDAALVYFFGHGGRVRFPDLPQPWGEHVFGYVTCHRASRGGAWDAVLDQELSTRMTALDARCGNVTAMFDCCFSGELVRDPGMEADDHRVEAVAPWVQAALERSDDVDLALESHPRIVRLCGASPKREAFAATRGGRQIGRLTEAFITAIDEAGDAWPRLCWGTLGHRLREHVIGALQMEGQWVNLAGPRGRRLFDTEEVSVPGTIAFVPGDEPERGWIRAGWHQGVSVGDRWCVLDPRTDAEGRWVVVAEGVVESMGRNRAEVVLTAAPATELRAGSPACLQAIATPLPVVVPPALRERVEASAWLSLADAEPLGRVVQEAGDLRVEGIGGLAVVTTDDAPGCSTALDLLEDRARRWTLDRCLAERQPSECPVRWSWFRTRTGEPLPPRGAVVDAGERIHVELAFEGSAPLPWFVAVVLVDPAGRLTLLSVRMPEGIELGPGHRERIGVRTGLERAGLELRWPTDVPPGEGEARLWFLASRRPIALEHLVEVASLADDASLALPDRGGEQLRSRRPEHARGCSWGSIDFTLRTCGRDEP